MSRAGAHAAGRSRAGACGRWTTRLAGPRPIVFAALVAVALATLPTGARAVAPSPGPATACPGPSAPSSAIAGFATAVQPAGDRVVIGGFRKEAERPRALLASIRDRAWSVWNVFPGRLASVTALALAPDDDVLVVGWQFEGASELPFLGRLGRMGWQPIDLPRLVGAIPTGVVAPPGNAFIVGAVHSPEGVGPLVVRVGADGAAVETIDPPDDGSGADDAALTAIVAAADGVPWAVGWELGDGRLRPLALRRDGTGWRRVMLAELPGDAVLTAVDAAPTAGVIAAGARRTGHRWIPFTVRLEGSSAGAVMDTYSSDDAAFTVPTDLSVRTGASLMVGATAGPGMVTGWPWSSAGTLPHGGFSGALDAWSSAETDWAAGYDGDRVAIWVRCDAAGWRPYLPDVAAGAAGGDASSAAPVPRTSPGTATAAAPRPVDGEDRGPWPAPGGMLRDLAPAVGLGASMRTWDGVAADLDEDGRTDLMIGGHGGAPLIARNVGGRFEPFTNDPLPPRDRHGCAAGQVDGAPGLDLVCAIGARKGTGFRLDELWLGIAVAHPPVDGAVDAGIVDPFSRGRRMLLFDADGDEDDDLLVLPEAVRYDGLPSVGRFYRNRGGRFTDDPAAGLDGIDGGACGLTADLDLDGRTDVVTCGRTSVAGLGWIRIAVNDGDRFTTVDPGAAFAGLDPVTATAGDFDGDGRTDLAIASWSVVRVVLGRGDGTFSFAWQRRIPGVVDLTAADVNGDGRDDLYATTTTIAAGPDQLLIAGDDGRSYATIQVPRTTFGTGDAALALDADGDGRDEIVVLNGAEGKGPIRLLDLDPAAGP